MVSFVAFKSKKRLNHLSRKKLLNGLPNRDALENFENFSANRSVMVTNELRVASEKDLKY